MLIEGLWWYFKYTFKKSIEAKSVKKMKDDTSLKQDNPLSNICICECMNNYYFCARVIQ